LWEANQRKRYNRKCPPPVDLEYIYTNVLDFMKQCMTDVKTKASEQHIELGKSSYIDASVTSSFQDLLKIQEWFDQHDLKEVTL